MVLANWMQSSTQTADLAILMLEAAVGCHLRKPIPWIIVPTANGCAGTNASMPRLPRLEKSEARFSGPSRPSPTYLYSFSGLFRANKFARFTESYKGS